MRNVNTKILSLVIIADTNKAILFSDVVKSLIRVFTRNNTPGDACLIYKGENSFER